MYVLVASSALLSQTGQGSFCWLRHRRIKKSAHEIHMKTVYFPTDLASGSRVRWLDLACRALRCRPAPGAPLRVVREHVCPSLLELLRLPGTKVVESYHYLSPASEIQAPKSPEGGKPISSTNPLTQKLETVLRSVSSFYDGIPATRPLFLINIVVSPPG